MLICSRSSFYCTRDLAWDPLWLSTTGSTSVAGLADKDGIDVQVTAAVLDEGVILALTSPGYTLREGIR